MFANDDGATERNYFKISVILQGFLKFSNHLNAFSGKSRKDEASEGLKQCETPGYGVYKRM